MYARVALDSPLPQLDRLFDYEIPESVVAPVGARVIVPFGKSNQSGFIVDLSATTEWTGKIAQLTEVVSPVPVLNPIIYKLVRAVADRQACTFGDVVGSAVPKRAVRVEKALQDTPEVPRSSSEARTAKKFARLVKPSGGTWVTELVSRSKHYLDKGESVIIAAPDFRDVARLATEAAGQGLQENTIVYTSEGTSSENYKAFLEALTGNAKLVIGTRNSLYAPVDAAAIFIWDEADQSHTDQSAPYASSREIALIRQSLTNCDLGFFSHSRSADVQRLVSIGYLDEEAEPFAKPAISVTTGEFRVDSAAWLAIRDGLKAGPVLVQVASTGTARSLYCKNCSVRVMCKQCNGPIWVDGAGQNKCRWCNAFALDVRCTECGSAELRQGRAGATRTVAEFGRSFPGTQVLEVRAEERVLNVDAKPKIVVATPGIEPVVEGGYSAVVLLDCQDALSRDSLKASETAVRQWANAISLLSPQGRAVAVGIVGDLAQMFALWQLVEIAELELQERTALRFSPAVRMLSAQSSQANLQKVRERLSEEPRVEIIGQVPETAEEWKLLARFPYSAGPDVSKLIRSIALELSGGQKRYSAKSGRAMRPVTFKLDDPQVL